jgi:hypothetical protein
MKVSILKIAPIVALALSAATSAATAMPGAPLAGGGPSVVLVDCQYGWYRGPDGRCYIEGTGPRYHRGGGYYERRRHRGDEYNRGDEYRRDEYRRQQVPSPFPEAPFGQPQY